MGVLAVLCERRWGFWPFSAREGGVLAVLCERRWGFWPFSAREGGGSGRSLREKVGCLGVPRASVYLSEPDLVRLSSKMSASAIFKAALLLLTLLTVCKIFIKITVTDL